MVCQNGEGRRTLSLKESEGSYLLDKDVDHARLDSDGKGYPKQGSEKVGVVVDTAIGTAALLVGINQKQPP